MAISEIAVKQTSRGGSWEVSKEQEELFTIEFQRESLLGDRLYVMLKPGTEIKRFSHSDLRRGRAILKDMATQYTIYCEVMRDRPQDLKFARAFGFRIVDVLHTRIVLEY